jgi:putative addiction module component (TIGR02574 family)
VNEATRALLQPLLALPEDQRAALVEALLDSLSDEEEVPEQELFDEIDKRRESVRKGTEKGVVWEDLRDEE